MDIQSTQSKHDDSICNPAKQPKLASKKLLMIQMIYSSWDFPSQATPCKYKIQGREILIQNFRNSREKSVRAEQYDSYAIIEYGTSGTVIIIKITSGWYRIQMRKSQQHSIVPAGIQMRLQMIQQHLMIL